MIKRIALVGASSTGKTTVYELLKNKLEILLILVVSYVDSSYINRNKQLEHVKIRRYRIFCVRIR
mgnify:CR=1 FL=1